MKMIFRELYLFSPYEKKARRIEFKDGINVITSNQEDGTDRGKSVVMRSLYHVLGAESYFETKWDTKNKIYILKFDIDGKTYYIYRSVDLYKFFDEKQKLIFVATRSRELAEKLKEYTEFAVLLPGRDNDKLEITPPVYNYLPFFLDQDHYEGSKYASFKKLQMYPDFKDSVLFYHLGIYDEMYFELVRRKERLTEEYNVHEDRENLLKAMQLDIESKIGTGAYSTSIDSLKKDIELYRREYSAVLDKLNTCKAKLIELRNNMVDLELLIKEMNQFGESNEKEIKKLNKHMCPECGSIITDTISLKSKRYNLGEDIIIVKNELQVSIQNIKRDIEKEEKNYQQFLEQLNIYDEKVKLNTAQANDIIRYKGLCEIREGVVAERDEIQELLDSEELKLGEIAKEIRKYSEKKKKVSERYYELLLNARTKFGLNEIDPDKFKKITNNFTASGSNRNIATVIWFLTILALRNEYNPNAIEFPAVFDSPNNVETDNIKKHNLLQYILENTNTSQLILSSIGFEKGEFSEIKDINVIRMENEKYQLLDEKSYEEYEDLMKRLCDAE